MALKGSVIAKLFIFCTLLAVLPAGAGDLGSQATSLSYRLRLYHLHTGEHIDVVYRIGDQYQPDGIAQLDHFLRDHRTGDVKDYDLKEFDLLHDLLVKLGDPDGEIDIVCGYRTPWSNNYLRQHGHGVAEHSQHMEAKAIDIRIPGVPQCAGSRCGVIVGPGRSRLLRLSPTLFTST